MTIFSSLDRVYLRALNNLISRKRLYQLFKYKYLSKIFWIVNYSMICKTR